MNGYLVWVWMLVVRLVVRIALIYSTLIALLNAQYHAYCVLCTLFAVRCTLHRRRNSMYSDMKQSIFNGNRFEFQFRISMNIVWQYRKTDSSQNVHFIHLLLLPQLLLSRVIILKRRNVSRMVMAIIYPCSLHSTVWWTNSIKRITNVSNSMQIEILPSFIFAYWVSKPRSREIMEGECSRLHWGKAMNVYIFNMLHSGIHYNFHYCY